MDVWMDVILWMVMEAYATIWNLLEAVGKSEKGFGKTVYLKRCDLQRQPYVSNKVFSAEPVA